MSSEPQPRLSHVDDDGRAQMVDVTEKPATARYARAAGTIRMRPETLALIMAGALPKGDVLAVARVAAVQGAKLTSQLIPLCHGLPLTGLDLAFRALEPASGGDGSAGIEVTAEARTVAATGVEMEALTAVTIALLTLYDMAKGVDRGMALQDVRLLEKRGGRSGVWQRDEP